MTQRAASVLAGLTLSKKTERYPNVQRELAKVRAEMATEANITREDVVQMLLDAANMAKLMSDPTAMIAAAREIGKMLGHYAPEVKKIMTGMDQGDIKKALENMSDEELLKLANARVKVIDGESARIEDKSASVEETDVPAMPAGETTEVLLQEEPNM